MYAISSIELQGLSWLWSYESVTITTGVVSSNLNQGEVYNIMS